MHDVYTRVNCIYQTLNRLLYSDWARFFPACVRLYRSRRAEIQFVWIQPSPSLSLSLSLSLFRVFHSLPFPPLIANVHKHRSLASSHSVKIGSRARFSEPVQAALITAKLKC